MRMLFAASCLMAAVMGLWAQDEDAQYRGWMKAIGGAAGSLRKNIEAKNGAGASTDAKKLQEAFGSVEEYWKKKRVADAEGFAKDAGAGFKMAGEQAAAGNFDEAAATVKKASANCGGCHNAHREKGADGSWKIK